MLPAGAEAEWALAQMSQAPFFRHQIVDKASASVCVCPFDSSAAHCHLLMQKSFPSMSQSLLWLAQLAQTGFQIQAVQRRCQL